MTSAFIGKGVADNAIVFFAEKNYYGELLPNGMIMLHQVVGDVLMSERVQILARERYIDEDAGKTKIEYRFISDGRKVLPDGMRKVLMSELITVVTPYLKDLGYTPVDLNDTTVVKKIIRKLGVE